MSHDDAEKFCKSLDDRSHLIEIYDLEIQKIVESIDVPSYHRFWIGATDRKEVNHGCILLLNTCRYCDNAL